MNPSALVRNVQWVCVMAILVAIGSVAVNPVFAQAEPPECNNGMDDDGDGATDFPDDQDCENPEDNTEYGHSEAVGTVVTIRYLRKTAFKGVVTASRNECVEQRRVVLRRRTPEGPRIVARTFTDDRGRWKVYWPDARGHYSAVAFRTTVPDPSGGWLVCMRDSATMRVRG